VDAVSWVVDRLRADPPSLAGLQAQVVSSAARRGYLVADTRSIDLQGTGQPARLFVFRRQDSFGTWLGSDELRIYDLYPNRLRLRLSFRPTPVERGRAVSFEVLRVRKIGDRQSVLAAFHEIAMAPFLSIPVVIDWDAARDRYRIKPVLSPQAEGGGLSVMPRLVRLFKPGDYAEASRSYYLSPVRLRDPSSGIGFRSYTAEAAAFLRDQSGDLLVGAFIVRARAHVDLPLLQIGWWRLNILQSPPVRYVCESYPPRAELVQPKLYEGTSAAMLRAWSNLRRKNFC
jgi:hypothetical protein